MATVHPGAAPVAAAPLGEAALAAGVSLSATQLAQFDMFRRLLLDWNSRFNLTSVTEPAAVDRRLFLDALRLAPEIDAISRVGDELLRLVDVGSGAGFPGLALKIARPTLDVTLIEATGKKVGFLTRVIAELGLSEVTAIHGRAEDVGHDAAHRGRYDLATARAVASLPALLELCLPLLRPGGRALFPKGPNLADELAAGERAAPLLGGKIASAAFLPGGETRLVVVEKSGQTPARFPRRAGIPAREPLGRVSA